MAYAQSYGTGPSNENYNMGVQSPYSPPNNGGPGNPGTASNMPKPTLPRFQQFQNNKGPAPLNPQDRAMQYFQSVMGGAGTSSGQMNTTPGPQWSRGNQAPPGYYEQGQQALQQQWNSLSPQERARYDQATQQRMGGNGGINPGNMYNMIQQFQNNKGPAPLTPQDRAMQQMSGQISGMQLPQDFNPWSGGFGQGGSNQGASDARQGMQNQYTGDPRHLYEQQRQTNNPLNQFGYGGQSQSLGRYVPPMMTNPNDLNAWNNQGGYAYNIPNSYGSGQWNQFNSRDVAFPNFGQSQNVPTPRLNPGTPPPSYQSPFGRPDPMRQQNYLAYMMNLAQGGQAQSNSTQPGAPDQPPPVV